MTQRRKLVINAAIILKQSGFSLTRESVYRILSSESINARFGILLDEIESKSSKSVSRLVNDILKEARG